MRSMILMEQILILFLIIAVGFYANKKNILTKQLNKGLSDLLLNITLPALIISSFSFRFSKTLFFNAVIILTASFIIHLISYYLGKAFFSNFPAQIRKILIFTTVFSNCGFMGFPIIEGIYGKMGIFYNSLYLVGFNLLAWTIGIFIFTEKSDWRTTKDALVNPGIAAVGIGMILFIFSIKLPIPLSKTISLIGSMTTPLSMIIVGSILAECDWKELLSGFSVYYGALIRLVVLPLLTFIIMKFFKMDPIILGVCVLSVAMPSAALTALFAEKYNSDALFASRSVFISTALSILTIPLILTTLIMK